MSEDEDDEVNEKEREEMVRKAKIEAKRHEEALRKKRVKVEQIVF